MDGKEITLIAVLIILALLAWVGYNFLNPIKVAPISLVPSGSIAATNPTSQTAINTAVQAQGISQLAQAQALQSQTAYNNQVATYASIGAGLGGLIAGLSGSGDTSETN